MTAAIYGAARRRALIDPPATTPPTLTYTSGPTLLLSDGVYNAFPGVTRCPNGDLLAAYRAGATHTSGGSLYALRSTDNGATWDAPALVAPTSTYGYGTATPSVIDGGRLAIVSWVRPVAGGIPYPNGVRIFISDDNGTTWGAPLVVTIPPGWLGMHSVSESPLVYRDGWFYLAVWGVDAGEASSSYYQAGVIRSLDLVTWERVAHFDTGGANGFNECGVAAVGNRLVCVIRHESAGRWVSTSTDGAAWSAAAQAWGGYGQGAPKLAQSTMLGWNIFPVRPASTGVQMACVNSAGSYFHLGTFATTTTYMYGQVCKLSESTGGLFYAIGGFSGGVSDLYWRTFSLDLTVG